MEHKQLTELLEKMTLEEKIAQMLQLVVTFFEGSEEDGQITGPMKSLGITAETVNQVGSVLGLSGAAKVIQVQQTHLKNDRLGIPMIFMADIIHGYKTIFPIPLAIGCSWDQDLAEQSAAVAAKEAAVSGLHVTFAPMVDLVRDPRWGRVMESTGEDTYLNSIFARAFVRGFQGEDLKNDVNRVAACVKHFAAYGAGEGGREYNTVDLSERQLREYYLPAYKAALDEGCELVMTSFNTVHGSPATGNRALMRDLLRTEWEFDGVIISDWGAVIELIAHGVAEDEGEAAYLAVQAGVDIEMMTSCYVKYLPELIRSGKVDESLINEAVLRILNLKNKLGLFENPLRGADPEAEREVVYCDEHRAISRELASKSCVLLKNTGVLPLQAEQKIALIGPFAQSTDILGPWSWMGAGCNVTPLNQAFQEKISASNVVLAEGSGIDTITDVQIQEAIEVAYQSDVIVLALGESTHMSGEGGSRADISLPAAQLKLITHLKTLDKPMVAILFNGRPLDLHGVHDQVDAVLEAWFPGGEGASAITDILYGEVNPSGRLSMSFPHAVGQIPVYYNHFNTGRPKKESEPDNRYASQYLDIPNEPLFPFGYGLSYTEFEYGEIELSAKEMKPEQPLQVTATVTNTGQMAGEEVVQLYIRDITGEVVRPMRELKAFIKILLQPGECREVNFILTEEQLRYHHSDLSFSSDAGEFVVLVGANSRDVVERRFRLVK
ncbi:beta-glucosidase [Paenibacillus anaericanus]|uniref:glycoside hydrolase family 3 N-terminal domain-containing protein n=1 Tax=Paenibacillus anaericanus TaxID=170367 RepID=UPI0027876E2B|nr:glycoside hydrolase family 3 N-terminal domain-containing protein [Paenibacillus anaericanus]MDQ0087131.1 beta-glucosidase [Paenibacillus anaericanus]